MKTIRIFLIDPNSMVRAATKALLETDPSILVVGGAADPRSALSHIKSEEPNVVLLDMNPERSSDVFDMLPKIIETRPASRILILTTFVEDRVRQAVALAGAHGVLSKDQTGQTLNRAIRCISEGGSWFVRSRSVRRTCPSFLTPRERQITALIARGLVNKEIANQLLISEKTVRNHLTMVYSKLTLSSRLELAIRAEDLGLR